MAVVYKMTVIGDVLVVDSPNTVSSKYDDLEINIATSLRNVANIKVTLQGSDSVSYSGNMIIDPIYNIYGIKFSTLVPEYSGLELDRYILTFDVSLTTGQEYSTTQVLPVFYEDSIITVHKTDIENLYSTIRLLNYRIQELYKKQGE